MPIPTIDFGKMTQEEMLPLAKRLIREFTLEQVDELIEWIEKTFGGE